MAAIFEWIRSLDQQIFHQVNIVLTNPVLDHVLPFMRNKNNWIPFYVLLVFYFLYSFRKKGLYLVLSLVLTVFIADQLSSSVIKPLVARYRPCYNTSLPFKARALTGCSDTFSFPSSHATNHFAIACFLIFLFHKKFKWATPLLLLWAFLISYAQVYVGLHYPSDVFCGAILGSCIGFILAYFAVKWIKFNPADI